ncbi:hypothetical protein F3Y22_tig00111105pilonHSYRG00273 [Hibiscus syriacus]|uniref:JmjC domain-containing protein n=1 Tax=Hibiscus syriacus TaxID=106335 RepID=A0A6A2Z0U1_HIBSY|nr:hypothetical protein F3Y22_tig00111105pilonHSYRG00273 [Hibiscus syriacus]
MGSQIKREINSKKLNSSERRKRAKTNLSTARTNLTLIKGETNAMKNPKIMEKYKLSTELEWVDQFLNAQYFIHGGLQRPALGFSANHLLTSFKIREKLELYLTGICKIVSPWKSSVPASDVLMKEQKGFEFKAYVQHLRLHQWNLNDMANFLITESDQHGQSNGNLKFQFLLKSQTFQQLPSCSLRLIDYQIPGITFPKLCIGMLFSTFAWHVEDHYLYSINYHHLVHPKLGTVSPDMQLPEKTTMFPPNILLQHNVPVYNAVQKAAEYVITFPSAAIAARRLTLRWATGFRGEQWPAKFMHIFCKMPILPYEELLCKEAIILSESSNHHRCAFKEKSGSQSCVRRSFVRHIESLKGALRYLHDSMPWITYSSVSQGTIVCQLCKRDCHLTPRV